MKVAQDKSEFVNKWAELRLGLIKKNAESTSSWEQEVRKLLRRMTDTISVSQLKCDINFMLEDI